MRSEVGEISVRKLIRDRSSRPEPAILIAPLIDIVFLLLIFFMLVTRFLSPSIAVALPESETGAMDDSRSMTLVIDEQGRTFLGDASMSLDEITAALADARESGEIDVVRLRADKHTPFELIIDALDAIRKSGIEEIAVETSPAEVDSEDETGERE